MRRRVLGVLGLSLVFILAGSLPAATAPCASTAADGTWLATSDAPLHGRYRHSAIWTGEAMLIWGGYYHLNHFLNDGALYDPHTDAWTTISSAGAPVGRLRHSAVWTGSRMIIWGGEHAGGGVTTNSGGLYHLGLDQWEATSLTNAPAARQLHTAIWAGSEMIVWGGCSSIQCTTRYGDGYKYDPATDSWTRISSTGAPSARFMHTAVWTGEEMIIWGGCGSSGFPCTQFLGDGARYNPSTDTWTDVASTAAPSARRRHTAVWGRDQMLVWGGEDGSGSLDDGGLYDPATDVWAPMSSENAPSARFSHTAVWTGEDMIVWGGNTDTGAVYSPALDTWGPLPTENAPSSRIFHVAVWAEDRMVVWGGAAECTPQICTGFLDTGGVYTPNGPGAGWSPFTGSWTSIDGFDDSLQRIQIGGGDTVQFQYRDHGCSACGTDENGIPLYPCIGLGEGTVQDNVLVGSMAVWCLGKPRWLWDSSYPLELTYNADDDTLTGLFSSWNRTGGR